MERKQYSVEFKKEVVAYADEHGPVKTAKQFQIHVSAIYQWRNSLKKGNLKGSKSTINKTPQQQFINYANSASNFTAALRVAVEQLRKYQDFSAQAGKTLAEIERILVGDTPASQRDTVDPLNDEEI